MGRARNLLACAFSSSASSEVFIPAPPKLLDRIAERRLVEKLGEAATVNGFSSALTLAPGRTLRGKRGKGGGFASFLGFSACLHPVTRGIVQEDLLIAPSEGREIFCVRMYVDLTFVPSEWSPAIFRMYIEKKLRSTYSCDRLNNKKNSYFRAWLKGSMDRAKTDIPKQK